MGCVVICFQNVSLIYWYSTSKWWNNRINRCDLLSKCIFDLLIFNTKSPLKTELQVVICFQNVSLIYWYSTRVQKTTSLETLWFAFKMYLWFIDIQQSIRQCTYKLRCDLLSKCIFDLLIFNWSDLMI